MKKSKRKKGDIIFKLDLEKAYDRVDRGFLGKVLHEFGFIANIISLILNGLSATSISLLWNGKKCSPFVPKRGLRQGDPLSPYLFVLCMEKLGEMINDAVRNGSLCPIKTSPHGPSISHLFFADDVLLFAKAKPSQVRTLSHLVQQFCSFSGFKVNIDKSRAFCSPATLMTRQQKLSQITGIRLTGSLEKYLGFKMFLSRPVKADFQDILDKVNNRLASWKGKLLNKAGTLTLVNSVMCSIPTYTMPINWLPESICNTLDRYAREFLWKGNNNTGIHLVNWETISSPRKWGGLGVRRARLQNISLLGKIVWNVLQ